MKPVNGNWGLEIGDWNMETGNWKTQTGNWRMETGNWELDGRNLMAVGACLRYPTSRPDAASYECSQGLQRMSKNAAVDAGE
jgi:hypothetical protein